MTYMTFEQAIRKAIEDRNPTLARQVADRLRACSLNYDESYDMVNHLAPISEAAWAELLRQADEGW